jgi:D-threonine aldolase
MNQQVDNQWYQIEDISTIDSPAFVVYPDRVKSNIRTAIKMAGDVARLRPHVKTHKAKEAALQMIAEGLSKFKCATIAEAEMLALCKAKDVLLAYQPVGPKLNRFIDLIKCYSETTFSCLVDNAAAVAELSQGAVAHHLRIPVYLDLNVGMNRTGIEPEKALSLYKDCINLPGIQPAGLHVYDGHIHHPSIEQRKKECDESFAPVEKLKQQIIQKGFAEPVLIAGGSPTFPIHCQREGVECSPGTFIYWDSNYEKSCPEQPFLIAALVITRVVSLPGSSRLCVDLGHKSIASENDLHHRVFFLNAPELKIISHSEEHLVLEAEKAHRYQPGDVLYGLPFHVCPTAALYERAITVENNKVTGEWKTMARDRKLNC